MEFSVAEWVAADPVSQVVDFQEGVVLGAVAVSIQVEDSDICIK